MSGFVVQGPKSDYRDSSGFKYGLYPFRKPRTSRIMSTHQPTLPETRTLPSAKGFAEYNFSGTRQTIYLPSAIEKTLGKKRHSANKVVCRVPRGWHSAKRCLPSAKGWALGKHPISEFSKNFKNSKQSLKIMRFGKMS